MLGLLQASPSFPNEIIMANHSSVRHPFKDTDQVTSWHDRFLEWMTTRVLASVVMFDVALIAPLLVLPMSDSAKLILAVFSSNWIQWWALPALQRSQIQADLKRTQKADADHEALTYLAKLQDQQNAQLNDLDRKITMLLHPSNSK